MKEEDTIYLFENIEMPLAKVLAKMEIEGIRVDKNILKEMGEEIKIKLELITKDIYNYAGCEFNINSLNNLVKFYLKSLIFLMERKIKVGIYY